MSRAFKCDRCGTCFDPMKIRSPDYFVEIKEYCTQNSEEYMTNGIGYLETGLHLCPKCAKMFSLFMSGKKIIEKEFYDALNEYYDAL